ncbi:nucleolar transcription factor 1-like isoform X2 [Brienomyrus brachyistius]|uniref:nucleolar transcription factor 1-like isoform X2 n=1 Tax=Brienomyrus brachyistius TaxID=42636 RepID=UPI0020B429C4|nr:nucleolar transcription factor 1-like isoform X2 [Brienomyrus brachyistius]
METTVDQTWPKEDLLKLLDGMKGNLPQNDLSRFKTMESRLDWDKVAFGPYSGDTCKQKWQAVSREVRKYRTLSEMIVDAEDFIKNPQRSKRTQRHPDFPKKPLTAYLRFFMEKRAKYAKLHPELSNMDLTKVLSRKYRELPERKKAKYVQEFQRDKEAFGQKVLKFREEHPDVNIKNNIPEKPKTPQQLWYSHKKKSVLKTQPDANARDIRDRLLKQWTQLSDKKRLKWINKSLEQQRIYEETMRDFIQQHPELNLSDRDIKKTTLTKAERHLKDKSDGRPEKPPVNGYALYCSEAVSSLKDLPHPARLTMCRQQWKKLDQSDRNSYQKLCERKKKEYEVEMDRFVCSLPKDEQQRVRGELETLGDLRKSNSSSPASKETSKAMGLSPKQRPVSNDRHPSTGSEAPRKPISALFIFSEEKRPKLQRQRPELSDSELTCTLAKMWNELPDKKKEKYERLEVTLKAELEKVAKDDRGLPVPPKRAQDFWQLSVMDSYLASFSNNRTKAEEAMNSVWTSMDKKKKMVWIKKAMEDRKRYNRELGEMQPLNVTVGLGKHPKFVGEPKKPPASGYHIFSQEVLASKELTHLPLKARMGEVGARWKSLSERDRESYKVLAATMLEQYKDQLDLWLQSLSPQERTAYDEYRSTKRKRTNKPGGSKAKVPPAAAEKSDSEDGGIDEDEEEEVSSGEESSNKENEEEEEEEEEEDDDDEDDTDHNVEEKDEDTDKDAKNKENESSASSGSSSESSESDSESDSNTDFNSD